MPQLKNPLCRNAKNTSAALDCLPSAAGREVRNLQNFFSFPHLLGDQEQNENCSTTTPSSGTKIGCIHFECVLILRVSKFHLREWSRSRL